MPSSKVDEDCAGHVRLQKFPNVVVVFQPVMSERGGYIAKSPVSTTEFVLQTWGYFGYRAIVLPKQHIVHCKIYQNNQDLSLPSGSDILPIY